MSGAQRELIMGDLTTRADAVRNTTTIALDGEFDVGAADELRRTLVETIMRHRPRRVVVDLGAVTFMDSTCIGTLVAGYHTACDVGVDLTVTDAKPFLAQVLATSGLHQLLAGRS
ncbi:STAS domain-containing protein [Planosporangium mesophilum]|nr:STAS domain-containing protein [Planosporangium mesophilum]